MSVVYNGAHSVAFMNKSSGSIIVYESWKDLHLIPASKPIVAAAKPNIANVSIPGSNKTINMTTKISGKVTYGQRTGTWEFYVDTDYWVNGWRDAYDKIYGILHGHRMTCVLRDRPKEIFVGYLSVEWKPSQGYDQISISYQFDAEYNGTYTLADVENATRPYWGDAAGSSQGHAAHDINDVAVRSLNVVPSNEVQIIRPEPLDGEPTYFDSVTVDAVPTIQTEELIIYRPNSSSRDLTTVYTPDAGRYYSKVTYVNRIEDKDDEYLDNLEYSAPDNTIIVTIETPSEYDPDVDGPITLPFMFVYKKKENGTIYTVPDKEYTIDWDDGNIETKISGNVISHKFPNTGIRRYDITVKKDPESQYALMIGDISAYNNPTYSKKRILKGIRYGNGVNPGSIISDYNVNGLTSMEYISFPADVNVSPYLMSNAVSVKAVILPHGISSIQGSFLLNAYNLESIKLPEKLNIIGSRAFENCYNLTEIDFSNRSITKISDGAFRHCSSLPSVYITSNSLTTIESSAFENCYSLSSFIFTGSTLQSIGSKAFCNCRCLNEFWIDTANVFLESIGSEAFRYCQSLRTFYIPNSVTTIGTFAFSACYSLRTIRFGAVSGSSSLSSIGNGAFSNCSSLTDIDMSVLPNLTVIPPSLFSYCHSLGSVILPPNLTTIGGYAFEYNYNLVSINMPSSVTEIAANAFYNCTGLKIIKMRSTTPPSISSSSFPDPISNHIKILVPESSLQAYKSASIWSDWASQIEGMTDNA